MTVNAPYLAADDHSSEASSDGGRQGLVSAVAWHRLIRLPVSFVCALWGTVVNLGEFRGVLKVLSHPEFAEMARKNPRFPLKSVAYGTYLARSFTIAQRASCFAHHYLRLRALLPRHYLSLLLNRDVTLTTWSQDGTRYAITLGYSAEFDREGELSLNLEVDREQVFVLSFTIVPGHAVGSAAEDVLLITRLQGVKGHNESIQRATKSLHDVAPQALLVAALEGAGTVLGIGTIGCISGEDQKSYKPKFDRTFRVAYDTFFTELGMERNGAGFFIAPTPLAGKPLHQIKRGHKLRTREKRAFKLHITQIVAQALDEICRDEYQTPREMELVAVAETLVSG